MGKKTEVVLIMGNIFQTEILMEMCSKVEIRVIGKILLMKTGLVLIKIKKDYCNLAFVCKESGISADLH